MKHNPGSKEAIEKGCTCPVIDNHYGKGIPNEKGEPLFWHNAECNYHWSKVSTEQHEKDS